MPPLPLRCLGAAALAAFASAQCDPVWSGGDLQPGPGGHVTSASVAPNGDLFVGGWFESVSSQPIARTARWDGTAWHGLGTGVDGVVYSCAALPNGSLLVGGVFATAGGQPAANLAVWNGATWAPFGGGTNGVVQAILPLPNGRIVVAGAFTLAGGVPVGRIAEWDGTSWSPLGGGMSFGNVRSLALRPNGELIAGGSFATAGGVAANGLARWNGAAWSGLGLQHGSVDALLIDGSDVLASGTLFVNATGVGPVARWNGATWSNVVPSSGIGTVITSLLREPNGDLLLAATFLLAGGGVYSVARWDGSQLTPFGPPLSTPVSRLARLADGRVLAVGGFPVAVQAGVTPVQALTNGTWQPLGGAAPPRVSRLATIGTGDVVALGTFAQIGGVAANNFARWNGVQWSALPAGPVTWPRSLGVASDGTLLVSGHDAVGATAARWSGVAWTEHRTNLDQPPVALISGASGELIAGGSDLLVSPGLVGVATWDGGQWQPLGALGGTAHDLARLPDGSVLAVGDFSSPAGPLGTVARWDGSDWSSFGVVGLVGGTVHDVEIDGAGAPVISGAFTIGGQTASVARWDGSAWLVLGTSNLPADELLILPNGDLVIGGQMTVIDGVAVERAARFDGVAWHPFGSFDARVFDLAFAKHGEVLVSGDFTRGAGTVLASWARATTPCAATAVTTGSGCIGTAGPVVLAALDLPWLGSVVTARVFGVPANGIVLMLAGVAPAAVPLAQLLPQSASGCSLLVVPDLVIGAVGSGTVDVPLALPNLPAAVGLQVLEQALVLQFGAVGLQTAASSNALQLTAGWF